ncbi:MAG TPA: hypothetical protein VIJ29_04635 [Candidatus Paceibacterota bacterium]
MKGALPWLVGIVAIVVLVVLFQNMSASSTPLSQPSQAATTSIPSTALTPVSTPPPAPSAPAPLYYQPMQFNSSIEADRLPFVNACLGNGTEWGKCNCDFDYLISHYGFAWFVESNANMQALGEIPYAQYNAAASYCAQYQ